MTDDTPDREGRTPEREPELRDKLKDWRADLVKLLVVGLPTLLVQRSYGWVADRLFDQPWHALWFVLPLAGAGWIGWRIVVRRERRLLLRGPLLVFFGAYVAAFSIAAQSDLLDWRRNLVDTGHSAPPSWILPARFGDWRYWLDRPGPGADVPEELVVVTVQRPADRISGRQQILKLLALASRHEARGIAFDFHLEVEPTRLDPVLCAHVERAEMPVVFGFRMEEGASGRWRPRPLAPALDECLQDDQRGHVMVLRDADRRVRLLPLRFGLAGRVPLSFQVAARLEDTTPDELIERADASGDGFFQPRPPPRDHPRLAYHELEEMGSATLGSELGGVFLLVGEDSPAERFETPRGERLGVQIHADAVRSLRTGTFFRRVPPWLAFGLIFVLCYAVTALAAAGAPAGRLVKLALAASLVVLAGAALAAWAADVWVDAVYALVAVWLLLALLLPLRRLTGSSAKAPEESMG